jgi:hypothetical protein
MVRDPARIDDILNAVALIWRETPDLRFCQIVDTMLHFAGHEMTKTIFYVEDDKVMEGLAAWMEKRRDV